MIDDKKSSEGSQNSIFLGHTFNKHHHDHCQILSQILMQQCKSMLYMILYSIYRNLQFLSYFLVFPILKPAHIEHFAALIRQSADGIHDLFLKFLFQ